jgi:quercetin dioxygenase-like cupin family protein
MIGKSLIAIAALSLCAINATAAAVPSVAPTVVATMPAMPGSSSILDSTAPLGLQENELADTDFVFNIAESKPAGVGDGGKQRDMNRGNIKGLRLGNGANGGGGNQVLFEFEPCGFRTPHLHPRGTENFHVLSGRVAANIIRETGGALISNEITKGLSGFFPEGHFHFLQNIGCDPASVIAMFDNSDPGVINTAVSLRLPEIQGTLGNSDLEANDEVINNTMMQSRACLKRCGLDKEDPKVYTTDYPVILKKN